MRVSGTFTILPQRYHHVFLIHFGVSFHVVMEYHRIIGSGSVPMGKGEDGLNLGMRDTIDEGPGIRLPPGVFRIPGSKMRIGNILGITPWINIFDDHGVICGIEAI